MTQSLPPDATKGFKRHRNSRYEIIMKIVSLTIQANPLDGVYFKQSYTFQLIKNFTKNEHYHRSASRLLPLSKSTNKTTASGFNHSHRRIKNQVGHLWWNLFAMAESCQLFLQKKSIRDVWLGCKYTSDVQNFERANSAEVFFMSK